jgi:hypothetical protein
MALIHVSMPLERSGGKQLSETRKQIKELLANTTESPILSTTHRLNKPQENEITTIRQTPRKIP